MPNLRTSATALSLTVGLSLSACGGGGGPISQGDLEKKLSTAGGLKGPFAKCVADALYPKLTDSEKKALQKESGSKALQGSVEKKAGEAGAACATKGVTP